MVTLSKMKKVCVLGANGFVGKNLMIGTEWVGVTRQDLDLTDQRSVEEYFNTHHYDVVIHCAVMGGSRLRTDDGEVTHKNLLMFENVVRVFKGKLLYFSSGAALRGNPPTDPYGLSKWLIDRRIETITNAYSLRIWGCYGPGELPTRFSAVCKRDGHVIIDQDRYFDFIDIEDVRKIVGEYVHGERDEKVYNLVYPEKLLLSQWAEKFGATWEIGDTTRLGEPYCCIKKIQVIN
jgi:nucleoside-diphosphate-sugar epimerase